ncbi:hypothetical protein K9N68_36760 (plasmid) [Kovacikia minuta CCNUW1]|nr:hypothetical protein [Kovacikia minuta]UBF29781.1 hypothetical protein K9N68_36760 [Kovacikia minuta CCNUW1]
MENIGLDRWLEANLTESLKRFQSQIEAEVLRQGVTSHGESDCDRPRGRDAATVALVTQFGLLAFN